MKQGQAAYLVTKRNRIFEQDASNREDLKLRGLEASWNAYRYYGTSDPFVQRAFDTLNPNLPCAVQTMEEADATLAEALDALQVYYLMALRDAVEAEYNEQAEARREAYYKGETPVEEQICLACGAGIIHEDCNCSDSEDDEDWEAEIYRREPEGWADPLDELDE